MIMNKAFVISTFLSYNRIRPASKFNSVNVSTATTVKEFKAMLDNMFKITCVSKPMISNSNLFFLNIYTGACWNLSISLSYETIFIRNSIPQTKFAMTITCP